MSRLKEDIRLFNGGIVSSVDTNDVPNEVAIWSTNVDSQALDGVLMGIKDISTITNVDDAVIPALVRGNILQKTLGETLKNILVYSNATQIRANDSVEITEANGLSSYQFDVVGTTFQPLNDSMYIGCGTAQKPYWAGYYKNNMQLNGLIEYSGSGLNDFTVDTSESTVAINTIYQVKNVGIISNDIVVSDALTSYHCPLYDPTPGLMSNTTITFYSVTVPSTSGIEIEDTLLIDAYFTAIYSDYPNPDYELACGPIPFSVEVSTIDSTTISGSLIVGFAPKTMNAGLVSIGAMTFSQIQMGVNNQYGSTTVRKKNDKLKWSDDNGATWSTPLYIPPNQWVTISNQIKFMFKAGSGHNINDVWTFTVKPLSDNFLIEEDTLQNYKGYSATTFCWTIEDAYFSGTGSAFSPNKSYIYGVSFVYDYLQETPVGYRTTGAFKTCFNGGLDEISCSTQTFKLVLNNVSSLSKRITSVNLYCAESIVDGIEPITFFRLVKSYSISPSNEFIKDDVNVFVNVKNTMALTASYEANASMPEPLEYPTVNYTYSTQQDKQLFVTKCFHSLIPNAERMVFRSKPYRYTTFDWANEYVMLDFVPTGIASCCGKIYVFGANQVARINPNQFFIEEIVKGIGLTTDRLLVVNGTDMFWGDENYAYVFDGRSVEKISKAIRINVTGLYNEEVSYSWNSLGADIALADANRGIIMFLNSSNGNSFVYDIVRKRWDFVEVGHDISGGITWVDGIIRLFHEVTGESVTHQCFKMFDGDNKAFTFYTKDFDFGGANQTKKFVKAQMSYAGTAPTLKYSVDKGTTWTDYTIENIENIELNRIRFRITGSADTVVNSLTIIYRPLIGLR